MMIAIDLTATAVYLARTAINLTVQIIIQSSAPTFIEIGKQGVNKVLEIFNKHIDKIDSSNADKTGNISEKVWSPAHAQPESKIKSLDSQRLQHAKVQNLVLRFLHRVACRITTRLSIPLSAAKGKQCEGLIIDRGFQKSSLTSS